MGNIMNMNNVRKIYRIGKTPGVSIPPDIGFGIGDYVLFESVDDFTCVIKRVSVIIPSNELNEKIFED